ncbi:hypothetical protein B0H14DRAFT_1395097 [Mycena olivaceomarginata]|nr:hypothetical protein B0H14DRAFT_1395097 [Mycena olivaceomarginata]
MTTHSSSLWGTDRKAYAAYFAESRAAPPRDNVASESLNPHEPYPEAQPTQIITFFDPSALQHTLGPATLNMNFVQDVLDTTGPVITPSNGSLWHFAAQPQSFPMIAKHEADYYDWFNWAVCYPAAHAVNAVRDRLYRTANVTLPADFSCTGKVNKTQGGGVADIIHQYQSDLDGDERPCTPHEFKRHKALHVNGESVLDFLVQQASAPSGYRFRSTASRSTLPGKGKDVVSQIINEMISTNTGHAVICTQEQYAMVRVTDTLQLELSPVYAVRDSATQARDVALLVLFYTHAALRAGQTYADARAGITAMRIILPAFPTWVFEPYEGIFRGGMIGRTKLVSKSRGSFLPLPWAWFDGDVRSSSNDVTIIQGRLVLLFVVSRRLIAKLAHGPSATQRLVREYNVYNAMRGLQGAAIPKMMGMYTSKDGKNTVLMMSYAGKALSAFSELEPGDKRILFHRLVRLHNAGVQHNDLEPRNVTKSLSGPFIIDFDHASLDHKCPGASCQELLQVAESLDLDPRTQYLPYIFLAHLALSS